MALPKLTAEQRQAALAKAAAARTARADVKAKLKAGKLKFSGLLKLAAKDEVIGKMKVTAALCALPGVGTATANHVMTDYGISATRRLRGLGPHQATKLVERFG